MSETLSFRRLFFVLGLIWLLLNLPVLLGHRVLPWDAMDEFYPTVYFNAHSLRLGLAPWWNPYIYSGYPQISDPQGMMFSPLLMIWMLLRETPGPVWFDWGVLLHLLMGGTAMLAMLRRDGVNAFGALIGATVFMAGGVAASRLEHTPDVVAYAYAPVVLLALRHFLSAPSLLRGCLLGLAAGALVTQLVQISYLFALAILTYAALGTSWHWKHYSVEMRRRWCAGMFAAMMCALILGLPQLLFSWAYMSLSNRVSLPLDAVSAGSLDAHAFFSLLAPNALHALHGTYDGPASLVEAYLYIGALPSLSLFFIGRAWRFPQHRRQSLIFAAIGLFAVLYMMGTKTPLYGWLYTWLPGMSHFRRPADAAYLLNMSLAVLAGIGAGQLNLQSRRQITALLIVMVFWLTLAGLLMQEHGARRQVATLLGAIASAAALWRLQKPGSDWRTALWLLAILAIDYRCFNLNGRFNEMDNTVRNFTNNPSVLALKENLEHSDHVLSPRITTLNTNTEWDNMPSLHDIASTQGYNPLRYALYDHWYGTRESSNVARASTLLNTTAPSKLDDLLGMRYLIIGHRRNIQPSSAPEGYKRVFIGDDVDIFRNDDAYARLLTPVHTQQKAVNQIPAIAEFLSTDFTDTLWLTPRDTDDANSARAVAATCSAKVQATVLQATPTQITIHTKASGPGWLVASELDFPGWQADVDTEVLPIHRANGIFRAVCVPSGEHRLRLSFHPWLMVAYAWRHRNT